MAVAKPTVEQATRRTPSETETSESTLIRARVARSTKQRVEFHKLGAGAYVVKCVHGVEFAGSKRYDTARWAAKPEAFCDHCEAMAEQVALEDEATPQPAQAPEEGDEAEDEDES